MAWGPVLELTQYVLSKEPHPSAVDGHAVLRDLDQRDTKPFQSKRVQKQQAKQDEKIALSIES